MATGPCTAPDCEKSGVLTRGWCHMHYRRWRIHGELEPPKRERARCTVADCDAPGKVVKGYCGRHAYRLQRHGEAGQGSRLYALPQPADTVCSIEGCDRGGLMRRGWCTLHYQRWQQHGDALWEPEQVPDICTIDGCDRPHASLGLCHTHYVRQRRTGTTDDPKPFKPSACRIDGCDTIGVRGFGLCQKHYCRLKAHGDPLHLERVRDERTSDTCSIDGCNQPFRAKGRCLEHYSAYLYELNADHNRERMRAHYRANRTSYYTRTQQRRQRVEADLTPEDREHSTAYREAIANDPCYYCGGLGEHVDHYYPLAKGGLDYWWNLVRACGQCNRRKAAHCGTWFTLRTRETSRQLTEAG